MNQINEKLESLKLIARTSGREAAKADDSDMYLVQSFALNLRGAWSAQSECGWDAAALTTLLNAITERAYLVATAKATR